MPDVISGVINAGGAAVVDYAVEPTTPSSPNIMLNTALSAFCGALLAVIIIIIKESLNTKVKGEGDLEYYFDIPVIANIPQITNTRGKEGAYEENNNN